MTLDYGRRVQGAVMIIAGVALFGLFSVELKQKRAEDAAYAARAAAEKNALAQAKAQAQARSAAPQVIALWTGIPVLGEPMGVHVADVGVDASGAVSLLLADNAKTKETVEAALAQARALPWLQVPVSTMAAPGTAASARPGEPRYAEGVAQFLAAKTGFKPQLQTR